MWGHSCSNRDDRRHIRYSQGAVKGRTGEGTGGAEDVRGVEAEREGKREVRGGQSKRGQARAGQYSEGGRGRKRRDQKERRGGKRRGAKRSGE